MSIRRLMNKTIACRRLWLYFYIEIYCTQVYKKISLKRSQTELRIWRETNLFHRDASSRKTDNKLHPHHSHVIEQEMDVLEQGVSKESYKSVTFLLIGVWDRPGALLVSKGSWPEAICGTWQIPDGISADPCSRLLPAGQVGALDTPPRKQTNTR